MESLKFPAFGIFRFAVIYSPQSCAGGNFIILPKPAWGFVVIFSPATLTEGGWQGYSIRKPAGLSGGSMSFFLFSVRRHDGLPLRLAPKFILGVNNVAPRLVRRSAGEVGFIRQITSNALRAIIFAY